MNVLGTIKRLDKEKMKIQVNLVATDLPDIRDHRDHSDFLSLGLWTSRNCMMT